MSNRESLTIGEYGGGKSGADETQFSVDGDPLTENVRLNN